MLIFTKKIDFILNNIITDIYTKMTAKVAKDYNKYLIDNNIQINIIDYVKELNALIYKIDISFIDNFLNLVDKDEICIPHKYLIDYGIITTENDSGKILRAINQFDAIEGADYLLDNVVEQSKSSRGIKHKKEYTLHPRLFKLCLMRSKNTLIYSKYYLLLEECIKYYNDYQLALKDNENKILHEDNIKTHIKLDYVINELKESNENSKRLREDNVNTHKELKEIKGELVETNENLVSLQDEFDVIHDKLDERVPNAKTNIISERFIILKHDNEKKYYIIARKERTMKITLDRLKDSGYKKILLEFKHCPNSRLLLNNMKDNMTDYYKFTTAGNCREFILLKTEQEYIDKLTEIYNSRRE